MLQQDDKWQKLRKNSQIQIRQLNDLATFRYSFRTEGMELFSIEDLISQLNHDYPDRLDICIHTVSNLIYGIKNNIICSVAALIENAMTAISASKAAQISDRQVHLQICTDNDLLHFIVTDYGCGFETDSNINPCAPFASCWKNHTGLGLSTARNTALRHGGNLIIKSLSNPTIVDFYIGIKN
jgi:nitrogen fixation/metabolism regulation signal transduction histidine kinase